MQLVEQHIIERNDPRYALIDEAAFKSKNLYNAALYLVRQIINLMVREGIGTLVIGKNPEWKQEVELGKRNNQNFVQIPHARFIDMLSYKARLVGIRVIIVEESYTSKCSFLDREPVKKHKRFVGKRVKRGLFQAANGRYINADVNGAYNIMRKVAPDVFGDKGVEDFVVHPVRIAARSKLVYN